MTLVGRVDNPPRVGGVLAASEEGTQARSNCKVVRRGQPRLRARNSSPFTAPVPDQAATRNASETKSPAEEQFGNGREMISGDSSFPGNQQETRYTALSVGPFFWTGDHETVQQCARLPDDSLEGTFPLPNITGVCETRLAPDFAPIRLPDQACSARTRPASSHPFTYSRSASTRRRCYRRVTRRVHATLALKMSHAAS